MEGLKIFIIKGKVEYFLVNYNEKTQRFKGASASIDVPISSITLTSHRLYN